jgi:hypothetical protein
MTRFVRCSGPCGRDVDARHAREGVLVWPQAKGKGGTQSAQGHLRTRVYVCNDCWRYRVEQIVPELRILAERMATIAQEILHFLVPKERSTLFDPEPQRAAKGG